jgi:glycine/D-amino acid oxidase-like deaminating enzyme/nitrite reductase/ring-hydroxylating ferredoxin subunit
MERDGNTTSLWQASMPAYPSKLRFPPNGTVFDVVVVGGGITGTTLANELAEAGMKCLLMEAHQLGFGTTGGTTAHINTFLETPYHKIASKFSQKAAGLVAQAVQDAINLLRQNVNSARIDCDFGMVPGYVYASDQKQTDELEEVVGYCQKIGVEAEFVEPGDFMFPYQRMARFPGQARFHPLKYIFGLASQFEKKGGVILQYCRLENVEERDGLFEVQSNLGNVMAKRVVYATHTPPHVNILHTLLAPYRSYVIGFELEKAEVPDILIYDMEEPYNYFRMYDTHGRRFVIAGGADHKTGDVENTTEPYRQLDSHIRKHFPVKSVVFRWSSQYYEPADGLAYIGELPGQSKNVYVATGFGGNGMIYSHVAAIVLRDLIVNGHSEYEDIFSSKRVKPLASAGKFGEENADVAKELVSGLLPKEKIEALMDLAAGEGRLVEYEGKKMGLYRDNSGNIYAVNPVCPHMKCVVKWNSTEKSWDCPCHGSRFSFTGELLTGPSTHNLEVYTLQTRTSL